uniref:Uncharacterized protein n=1 Tax=viral metagenome TaxID=1070528 RepID=A0A6M3M886_9ZZZZ
MPRIYDEYREPFDLCQQCYQNALDEVHFKDELCDFDAEHPSYDDADYECDYCHKPLTSKDDNAKGGNHEV